jgi:tetratricopeptide (TPR) repeat protein/tRNA A-37 threonylcarbamoyl transferase component Bud32
MTPERFRQIEELYHAACEADADQRAALLAQADPELRREVEGLLLERTDGEFLNWPAIQNAPHLLEDSTLTGLTPGVRLGPYEIESTLGEGGMGKVYKARDTRLNRFVAIKIAHQEFNARFEREARAISSLNHPHICTLHDIGPNYLVMELVEGNTIAARLKNGPLPVEEALLYAKQIASALVEAHERGIVHRDLKPGNIMIAKSGVKVLDFGLARSHQDETVTASRMILGTPAYMAPEQREGKQADERTDIYAFGCVFYEMLMGSRPAHDRKPLPSKALEKIVSRCLATDPGQRCQTAAELAQALEGVPHSEKNRIWIGIAAVVLVVLLAASYYYFRPGPKLTDKDTIVLADFTNTTGDPVFDGTLRQGLAIQLAQFPFLKIMDDEQVRHNLRLMNLAPDARITNQVAHEICVRDAAAATIDGFIASLGKSYIVTLQAIACQGGATLAREQVQADDKERVLNALGTAATAMRAKLGESRDSIQRLNRPLEQATTSSLEALQSFTAGFAELGLGHFLPAIPLFERAIELDPSFAMAYGSLADTINLSGDTGREPEYAKKAFALIDRVSEYERNFIAGGYYTSTRELDKAADAWRLGIANYPGSGVFHNNLSENYIQLGRFEDGLKEGEIALQLLPHTEPPYRRLLDAHMCLGRMDEAKKIRERALMQGVAAARVHQRFLEMAYIEDDHAAAAKEIEWYAGKPEEYLSFGLQAAYRNSFGQRLESSRLYKRAAETALRRGLRDVAAGFDEANARADALTGKCDTARRLGRPAIALAMCGDVAQAEKLAAETSKRFPNGTIWNAVQLPSIRAAIEIQRGQPAKAVQLLASASPYERAYAEAVYLRGVAYLALHKGAEAATEFQKILDHKGASWGSTWFLPNWGLHYSISYLGLARASVVSGDTATARKAYEDFLTLWKDADGDVPILMQAKTEYARLQ